MFLGANFGQSCCYFPACLLLVPLNKISSTLYIFIENLQSPSKSSRKEWVSLITASLKLLNPSEIHRSRIRKRSGENALKIYLNIDRAKRPWIERRRLLNDTAISGEEALDRASIAQMVIVRPS